MKLSETPAAGLAPNNRPCQSGGTAPEHEMFDVAIYKQVLMPSRYISGFAFAIFEHCIQRRQPS